MDDQKTCTHYIVMELANGGSLFSDNFYRNIKTLFQDEEEYLDTSSIDELHSRDHSLSIKKQKSNNQKRLSKT